MVVYKDTKPPSGVCDLNTTQTIIDEVNGNYDDATDIINFVLAALRNHKISYNFLSAWENTTDNNIVEDLNSACSVQNDQVFLYLD